MFDRHKLHWLLVTMHFPALPCSMLETRACNLHVSKRCRSFTRILKTKAPRMLHGVTFRVWRIYADCLAFSFGNLSCKVLANIVSNWKHETLTNKQWPYHYLFRKRASLTEMLELAAFIDSSSILFGSNIPSLDRTKDKRFGSCLGFSSRLCLMSWSNFLLSFWPDLKFWIQKLTFILWKILLINVHVKWLVCNKVYYDS